MYSLPSARRKKPKADGLNLTPILDVVFVLIFFLLFSVQLLRIYEIGSDLPIYQEPAESTPQQKKKKFELKVYVSNKSIRFVNSLSRKELERFETDWGNEEFEQSIEQKIQEIKNEHPTERRVVIATHKKVTYNNLVMILDKLRGADRIYEMGLAQQEKRRQELEDEGKRAEEIDDILNEEILDERRRLLTKKYREQGKTDEEILELVTEVKIGNLFNQIIFED